MRYLCFIFMPINKLLKEKKQINMFSKKIRVVAGYCTVAILGLTIVATSCRRDDDDDVVPATENTEYAEQMLTIEQIYSNADRVIERAFSLGASALKGGENPLGACATIEMDTTESAGFMKMTIKFAGDDCLGYDGRYRKGSIIVVYTDRFDIKEEGYYHKVTFDGYEVEGYTIAGQKEVSNIGRNAAGNISYDIATSDTIYLPSGSGTITGSRAGKREWYRGSGTPQTADDVYRLTGSGNFLSKNKDNYRVEIVDPLVDALDCNWLNEGVINIFPENATQRVLDFGKGECDDAVIISVNGVEREVKLP